ncbi:MAG: hypothetical protein ACE5D7_05945 [Fidelibacterota bacterium]
MSTVIWITIIIAALTYIFWPYLFHKAHRPDSEMPEGSGQLIDLVESRDTVLSTIKDLEFDYDIGKLSNDDFNTMNTQYRNKAINLIKKIELQKNTIKENEPTHKEFINKKGNICNRCKEKYLEDDAYCRNCGYQLNH